LTAARALPTDEVNIFMRSLGDRGDLQNAVQADQPGRKPIRAPLLRASGVAKTYREGDSQLRVLSQVDLGIAAGEQVALIGRSGSGKSTLLNLLGGIDRPDVGEITISGTPFSRLGERQRTLFRRRHIGFVYQAFNLIPTLTAVENVALPLELNGATRDEAESRAHRLLERIGLERRCHSFPDRLSGGEQQRVAIARALVHRPQLILADEPTGNLDAGTGRQVLDLLAELFTDHGSGLFIVTHSLEVARRADRVLTLVDGRLREHVEDLVW
jgi:putative ABC transport system ATP-binding protein